MIDLVGVKMDDAFYLLSKKYQIFMHRKLTPPTRTITKAALVVAFFSTQLFSQSVIVQVGQALGEELSGQPLKHLRR